MMPSFEVAYQSLMSALKDMALWDAIARQAKELMRDMLESRKSIAEVAATYDVRYALSAQVNCIQLEFH